MPLTDEGIATYIRHFFAEPTSASSSSAPKYDSKETKDDKSAGFSTHRAFVLHGFLKRYSNLWDISRNLDNLELICRIWADHSLDTELTVTELYQKLLQKIVRDRCQQAQQEEKTYLASLEEKAFTQLLVTAKSVQENNFSYHFSSHQFFAASYLVRLLSQSSSQEEAKQFIRRHKYDPNYERVFAFTAGLLRLNKYTDAIPVFWEAIDGSPRDLVGIAHLQLIVNCLEEGMDKQLSSIENEQLLRVKKAYQAVDITQLGGAEQKEPQSISDMSVGVFTRRHLIPLLKQNKRISQYVGIIPALTAQLLGEEKGNEIVKKNAITALCALYSVITPAIPAIVDELCQIALNDNSEITLRKTAIAALHKLTFAEALPLAFFDKLCDMAIVSDARRLFIAASTTLCEWVIFAPKPLQQKIITLFPQMIALNSYLDFNDLIKNWALAPLAIDVPYAIIDLYCKDLLENGSKYGFTSSDVNRISFINRSTARATKAAIQTFKQIQQEYKPALSIVRPVIKAVQPQLKVEPDVVRLCQAVQDDKADDKAKIAAIKSLGNLPPSAVTQQVMISLRRIVKTKQRSSVVDALGQLALAGNEAAASTLCELVQDTKVDFSFKTDVLEHLKALAMRWNTPAFATIMMTFGAIIRKGFESPRPPLDAVMFRGYAIDAVSALALCKKLPRSTVDVIADDLCQVLVEPNERNMSEVISALQEITQQSSPRVAAKIANLLSDMKSHTSDTKFRAIRALSALPLRSVMQDCLESLDVNEETAMTIGALALMQGRTIIFSDQGFQFYKCNGGIDLLDWQECMSVNVDSAVVFDQMTKALMAPALQCQLPVPALQSSWPFWQLLYHMFSQAVPFPEELILLIVAYTHFPLRKQATPESTHGAQIQELQREMNLALRAFPKLVTSCGMFNTKRSTVVAVGSVGNNDISSSSSSSSSSNSNSTSVAMTPVTR